MGNWQEVLLDSVIDIIDGDRGTNYPTQHEFSPTGYCLFLNAGNVTQSGFSFSNCSFITKEKDALLRKGKAQRQDIILTTRGTVGNLAYFDQSVPFDNIRINSGMVIFRPDQAKIDPLFCYIFSRSKIFSDQVKGLMTGSAQPQLPIRDIRRITLPLPDMTSQKAIAAVLGALDDKIELNRRMNATLEAMARALFKSWFVDFDPVRAKMEGKQPFGMVAATAALFPSCFVSSPLGDIPEGWSTSNVGSEFDITMGQSPPGETYNESGEGLPFYQGRTDFGFRYPTRRIFCTQPNRIAEAGDTLISVRAPVGDINMAFEKCILGRGVGALRHKSKARSYTYYAIHSIQENIKAFEADGTVFGSINKQDVEKLSIIKPSAEAIKEFEKIISSADERILSNIKEILELEKQRDYLLPKLISGDIRIPDVEKFLEALC